MRCALICALTAQAGLQSGESRGSNTTGAASTLVGTGTGSTQYGAALSGNEPDQDAADDVDVEEASRSSKRHRRGSAGALAAASASSNPSLPSPGSAARATHGADGPQQAAADVAHGGAALGVVHVPNLHIAVGAAGAAAAGTARAGAPPGEWGAAAVAAAEQEGSARSAGLVNVGPGSLSSLSGPTGERSRLECTALDRRRLLVAFVSHALLVDVAWQAPRMRTATWRTRG